MSVQASDAGDKFPEGDPADDRWRVGRRVRVEYEEDGEGGKKVKRWYPAEITAYDEDADAPFTLTFENGDIDAVQLPDNDIRALPDGPCAVCDKPSCYAEDLFVQCAACGLTVHQGCYGCRVFPGDKDWFCDLCATDSSRPALANMTQCSLCGKRGGALKRTVDSRFYAHLACVIWIPEAHVVDTSTMSPVEIRHVPISRQRLKCSLCKTKDTTMDAPVQCYEPTCARSFHVGCARASDEHFYIAINDNCEPVAFCPRHCPEEHKRPKEPKKRGGGREKAAGPEIKTISLKEVLSDPVLVDLEEKIKAAEANKRQMTGLLNDQMAQRMRNIEERRQKMRDRHLVYQQRRTQENAERAMDVNAANARAADAAAQHGLQPGAGVWQGTPDQAGSRPPAVGGDGASLVGGSVVKQEANAGAMSAGSAVPGDCKQENGSHDGGFAGPGSAAGGNPLVGSEGVGGFTASNGAAGSALAMPHGYPPQACIPGHVPSSGLVQSGPAAPAQQGMHMMPPGAAYNASFASMMGQQSFPPGAFPVFNEEEKKREAARQAQVLPPFPV